jgi:hypothetical protein
MNSDFNSNFNSKSNSSIQEIYIDIQEVEHPRDSSNDVVCGDCSSNVSGDLYIKRGIFDTLKRKTFGNTSSVGNKNVLNEFNSLQRSSIHSLHFDDCGSSGDDNYFGEHTSDLSDSYSEEEDSFAEEDTVFFRDSKIKSSDVPKNEVSTPKITYKKLNYHQVEKSIDKYYSDINHKYSSALDILASYLKGHKIIYMEAKSYSEQKLNMLMMPAILLSTAATVLASVVADYSWGSILISSVNAVIAFLLAIVNYLKLDAASEAHKISSHQYDKLQSSVEFTSGSILLFRDFSITHNALEKEGGATQEKETEDSLMKMNVSKKELEQEMMKKLRKLIPSENASSGNESMKGKSDVTSIKRRALGDITNAISSDQEGNATKKPVFGTLYDSKAFSAAGVTSMVTEDSEDPRSYMQRPTDDIDERDVDNPSKF